MTPLSKVRTSREWHAWHDERRKVLKWRLEQAEQAEWNWPSTRRRCDIHRIERELEELDEQEFVVPGFSADIKDSLSTI